MGLQEYMVRPLLIPKGDAQGRHVDWDWEGAAQTPTLGEHTIAKVTHFFILTLFAAPQAWLSLVIYSESHKEITD